ncbi:MAG: chitobiase/beta-hexosaminidase C-terminal domain-containing protein [Sphingobacteriales bacterium]|nr:chitobiase/beta-hexosaminidase C-terminal domain-containing protein [Sphingobacteriales bacterium]
MNWKNILSSLTIAANCLLVFFLLFYDRLVVPPVLQVAGRAHPLFLHFPIVLFALWLIWIWIIPKQQASGLAGHIGEWLLLSVAFTAALTALMGILLSKEAGYNPESLSWHKWSGACLSFILLLWYVFYQRWNRPGLALASVSLLSLGILLIAGDQGAAITHGDNFLLGPVYKGKVKEKVPLDEAIVYRDMVEPVLEAKCMSCHNSTKSKGGLVMTSSELLLKGGKSGAVLDTSDANMSLLLQRVHLPEEDKKHMPPLGKPQLNDQELAILYNWIRRGANFTVKVTELDPTDTLRTIAGNIFKTSGEQEVYDFSAASEDKIRQLNTNYRAVYPLAIGSPAIAVDFFGAAFYKPDQLKELLPVKTQLVSLNLAKMPVTDDELSTIGEFANLRELDLSFTKVTGRGLAALGKLQHLKRISLTNTAVHRDDVQKLLTLKELREIYVWNSGLSYAEAAEIKKKYPLLDIQTGARTDTLFEKINPPVNQTAGQVISDTPIALRLKHFVPGTSIRYTVDGTDPDSTHSIAYDNRAFIDSQVLVKARAFRKGWRPSDVMQYQFYRATYRPDTVILVTPTDLSYKGKGGATLNDLQKGSQNFGDGKWIAYRRRMECLLKFPKPVRARSVTVSSLVNVGSMIFPPKSIRIMGGDDPGNLRVLYQLVPPMDTMPQSNYLIPYECKFPPTVVKYIRVMVEPIGQLPPSLLPPPPPPPKKDEKSKLPSKTPPKKKEKPNPDKDKGWFFVDELFVN